MQKIIKIIKKTIHIRDMFSTLLLLVALTLCFVLILNGIYLNHRLSKIYKRESNQEYKTQFILEEETTDTESKEVVKLKIEENFLDTLVLEVGNVIMPEFSVQCGDSFTYFESMVFLKCQEEIVSPLESGRYPTTEDMKKGDPVVVVGNKWNNNLEIRNGIQYLRIDGEFYRVIGVLEDNTTTENDQRIFLFYNCLTEHLKNKIQEKFSEQSLYKIAFQSNQPQGEHMKERFFRWVEKYDTMVPMEQERTIQDSVSILLGNVNQVITRVLIFFSVVNCMVISTVWIGRRRKEFAIRKAFGANMFKISGVILGELFRISILSLVISLLFQKLYYQWIGKEIVWGTYLRQELGTIIFFVLSSILLTAIIPIKKVIQISPVQEIQR